MNSKTEIGELLAANRIANELLEQSQVLVAKLVAELSEADEATKNARLIADYLYIKARTIQLEVSRSPEASGC